MCTREAKQVARAWFQHKVRARTGEARVRKAATADQHSRFPRKQTCRRPAGK